MAVELPVGFHRFSKIGFINYQLNRWYSLGYTRLADIETAGREIPNVEDNKRVSQAWLRRPCARVASGTPPSTTVPPSS